VNSVLDINGTGALVIPDIDAVILAFPFAIAVADPVEDMAAMALSELTHVT
jgi:hypothetical protein